MKAELRADGLHISGYVNVTGRQSRPVITPRGKVIEVIEQRAFSEAIEKAQNIKMLEDHDDSRELAQTIDGTLKLHEDEIGLRAEAVTNDPQIIDAARSGKVRGWSFRMRQVLDSLEERAEDLPIRHVKGFLMDEVSVIVNKLPVYSATSFEFRAEDEQEEIEIRSIVDADQEFTDSREKEDIPYDNSIYQTIIDSFK